MQGQTLSLRLKQDKTHENMEWESCTHKAGAPIYQTEVDNSP